MLGFLHNLILIIAGLYILFTAPFSSLSAVLTFTCLRALVHPYFAANNTNANFTGVNAAPVENQTEVIAGASPPYTDITRSELLFLIPCTGAVLSLAYLVPRHYELIRHLVYLVECSEPSLATERFVRRLMGYDPAKPATWSISQLRSYAAEHHITISSGCEKSELVALVDECLTNALLAEHIRKENALDDAVLPDLLAATTAKILHYRPYPAYAQTLRQHPQKLREILQGGLRQLESLTFVARLCGAQLQSPVSAWLEQVAHAEDGGLSFQAALTPADGAAATSSVCGRFCGDGDMVVRCLDCGADPTCVMCMDCFRHSPCVNHRYRITQGSGGGMCDCGDPTAWKPESFCSRHRPAAAKKTESTSTADETVSSTNPVDALAEEDREWVVVLLRGIIQYISLSLLQSLRICEAQKRAKAVEKKAKKPAAATPAASGSTKSSNSSGTNKGGSSSASAGASAASAPCAPVKDPEATLMEDVALIADNYDWLSGWLVPVTNRLWELMSTTEVAKQIAAELWMEPLYLSADCTAGAAARQHHDDEENAGANSRASKQKDAILAALPDNFSYLHPVFLFEVLRPVTDREKPLKRAAPDAWRSVLAKCVGHCLSVARLRLPVGALMATYAECINAHDSTDDNHYPLHEYQVQVLTNPDVLKHLMTPSNMPYSNPTNTVLHRVLSSIFYTLCVSLDQGPRNPVLRTSSVGTDGLIFIEHQNEYLSYGGITVLNYCLTSLPAACYTLVVNRLAWRALVQIHGTLAISGYIYDNPEAPTDDSRYPAPDFFARILSRHTWLWFHAMRSVLSALMRLPVGEARLNSSNSLSMPAVDPAALTAALQVPAELWQRWTEATRFDAPADVSRRRRVFLQMLSSCQVRQGQEEALLLLQHGQLAAAQAAALQQHVLESEGAGSSSSRATPAPAPTAAEAADTTSALAMPPSLATAVGYAVQMLYEISRTMDAVFQKQRDGFCQRCHTIALERENRPGAAVESEAVGDCSAQQEKENEEETEVSRLQRRQQQQQASPVDDNPDVNGGNEEEESEEAGDASLHSMLASPTLPPSQSPVDVFEYNLLQPSTHATTFSNHLPHMFGTVLTAWVIEQRRSNATAATAAFASTTRLSGLCEDAVSGATTATTTTAASPPRLARPLRTVLDCFFKLRANAMPHLVQDRLTFCQQLLDSLVLPQVLIGQVLDGMWRRNSYGVSTAVSMYIGFSRSVAAEFDILMMQVLTMELPPADMAIQILRRFSYAKEGVDAKKRKEQKQQQKAAAAAAHGKRRESGGSAHAAHQSFSKYLKGYKHYLRLMLTLVVDSTKAAFHPPLSSLCIDRTVAHYLAQKKASHSTIIQVVSDSVRGGDFGTAEEDEKDSNGNVIRFTQLIDSAIKKLAVAQDTSRGKQFRLRDVQTWKNHVSLYQSSIFDAQLEEVHGNYRSIAVASRATAADDVDGSGDHADGAQDGNKASNRYPLPPTQLSDSAMYPELLPTTRALLHTDALLLPALYVLHKYVNAHAPPPPPSTSSPTKKATSAAGHKTTAEEEEEREREEGVAQSPRESEAGGGIEVAYSPVFSETESRDTAADDGSETSSSDSEEDEEDTNLITKEALLHAVTALFLCVQDCRSITRAMQAMENATAVSADDTSSSSNSESISWDLVELYLQRYRVNELSFTAASCAAVLPLPELARPRTLLHKLQTHVTLHLPPSMNAKAATVRETSADMLHRLRTLLRANADADIYSCVEMVEDVLVRTGLATFATAAAAAEQQSREEALRSRKKLIQERQAKLMQRMRSRALKTNVGNSSDDPASPTTTNTTTTALGKSAKAAPGAASSAAPPAAAAVTSSLLTKMLLELATLDCCVCRANTDEPLFLLCHTGTSSVLSQLGALALPDSRTVHNHLCICGHAAHKTCVEKLFVRLSVLWQRWNFRSQLFLGPTEFNCPMCNMIVTALSPVPALPGGVASPASPGVSAASVSLFEELQSGTMHPDNTAPNAHNDRTEDVVVEFQTTLANSAVGFSPSEDIPALVEVEDSLQKSNEAAWIQSETIRTFFYASHLLLEDVKAGHAITHRHLIGLLSLLVSLTPAKLHAAQVALRANYTRTHRDGDSLLLLDALMKPREAAQLIRTHLATQVLPAFPPDYVLRLFACAEQWTDADTTQHTAADADEDGKEATSFESAAAALEADYPNAAAAVWKEVGVLTLLKALLVEDASHAIILGPNSFTLNGTVTFTTLSASSITTPAARCTATLRMLQYLFPVAHKEAAAPLPAVAHDLLQYLKDTYPTALAAAAAPPPMPSLVLPTALPYTNPAAYVDAIAETVLHLPQVYATVLTAFAENKRCSVCHKESANPVLCCYCGRTLCMHRQRSGEPPELHRHVRSCGGAVGLFLAIRVGAFYVMELTSGRLYSLPSNYVDEYGERDRNLRRGVPLFRDREETQKLIELWMQNRWGAVSSVFTNSNRIDLTGM